ncbi:MAG: DUF6428 family protein [Proteobacteria bacterium]|nr:DUF6428 family protein [Pseudomonadota bacterium]
MLEQNNTQNAPQAGIATELTLADLLTYLDNHREKPLVFVYGGNLIRAGYHVTEVKAGQFSALDCGANAEAWTEIFVQLWDVNGDDRQHMPSGKFAAIVRKVSERVALDQAAKLTFEVSDSVRPMQLFRAITPALINDTVQVELSARPASCKPRDRWLETSNESKPCCGPASSAKACCG